MSFDNSCHHIASALTFYWEELRVIEKQQCSRVHRPQKVYEHSHKCEIPGKHLIGRPISDAISLVGSCSQIINFFKADIPARNDQFNHISHKIVSKIDTLNMKICWVFMKIWILFK